MEIEDFRHVRHFPGTEGNPFDRWLRVLEDLQKLPAVIFLLILFFICWLPLHREPAKALLLFVFFSSDWLSLSLLPHFKRSFGPPRPTALLLALFRLPFAFLPSPFFLIFQLIGSLLVFYGFWIEPHRLTLTRETLASPKLPANFSLRLLHLGDLHVERITQREIRLNELIQNLQPDLILFSGDILNLSYLEDPQAIQDAIKVISEWRAPLGVFLVSGSEAVDLAHVIPSLIDQTGHTWLDNQAVTLEHRGASFDLIGITCSHRPFVDAPILEHLIRDLPNRFRILLYHSPDLAPNAAKMGVDLQLSGHTHGGQIRLPWIGALYTASLYGRKFQSGRYLLDSMTLYITRGIGLEGKAAPRVRFLCPPEIILWEITGKPKTSNTRVETP